MNFLKNAFLKRWGARRAWGFAALAAAGLVAGGARADMAALVIGIDGYRTINRLQGAVNDARDIADALKAAGARDVRLLVDDDAERDRIMAAWHALIAGTGPNDTLVMTYAGHGGQEPERIAGSEVDGQDEVLLLTGFAVQGAGTRQRISDDELALMLKEAAPRRVIFVADACHSGTMTRSFDSRAGWLGTRAATYGPLEDDELPLPTSKSLAAEKEDMPHVTFFAAVPENELAPEVLIDGKPRGALSWAFARALRGGADRDGDGVLSKGELEIFIRETVRMKLEGRQHPQVQPAGRGDEALIQAATVGKPTFPGLPQAQPLAVRLQAPPAAAEKISASLSGVVPASDAGPAALIWDATRGEVVADTGDVVATVAGDPADPAVTGRLQRVVDKWSLIIRLKAAVGNRPLTLELTPDDRIHRRGERLTLQVSGNEATYFTLLNLAADGTVNFLYPLAGGPDSDPLQIPKGKPYRLMFSVEPPFGADHFIAITSTSPLTALHKELVALDGRPAAAEVAAALSRHLTGQTVELGIHGVYTGAR